jgi:hypothetical protein
LTPVANLPPVSLIPVVNLELRISPRIFEKIRNATQLNADPDTDPDPKPWLWR